MSLSEITQKVLRIAPAPHDHFQSKKIQIGRDTVPGVLRVRCLILDRSTFRSRLAAMAWTQSRRRLDRIGDCREAAQYRAEGPLANSYRDGIFQSGDCG